MSTVSTRPKKSVAVHAVWIKADGSEKNLGLISYTHKNPVINFIVNRYIKLKEYFRK